MVFATVTLTEGNHSVFRLDAGRTIGPLDLKILSAMVLFSPLLKCAHANPTYNPNRKRGVCQPPSWILPPCLAKARGFIPQLVSDPATLQTAVSVSSFPPRLVSPTTGT